MADQKQYEIVETTAGQVEVGWYLLIQTSNLGRNHCHCSPKWGKVHTVRPRDGGVDVAWCLGPHDSSKPWSLDAPVIVRRPVPFTGVAEGGTFDADVTELEVSWGEGRGFIVPLGGLTRWQAVEGVAAALHEMLATVPAVPVVEGDGEEAPPFESIELRQWDGTVDGLRALAAWAGNDPTGDPQFSWLVGGDQDGGDFHDPMLGNDGIKPGDLFAMVDGWAIPARTTKQRQTRPPQESVKVAVAGDPEPERCGGCRRVDDLRPCGGRWLCYSCAATPSVGGEEGETHV